MEQLSTFGWFLVGYDEKLLSYFTHLPFLKKMVASMLPLVASQATSQERDQQMEDVILGKMLQIFSL